MRRDVVGWALVVCGVIGLSAPCSAGVVANLIVNGDAEAGPGSTDGYLPVVIPSWTAANGPNAVQWAVGAGFPDVNSAGPTNRGANFFSGGNTATSFSTLSQTIDLSSFAAGIDAGTMPYTLCGFLGGFSSQSDNAELLAQFLDGSSGDLGSASIGPVTPAEREFATKLCLESTSGTLPPGTRSVAITVQFNRVSGAYVDGYADNLNFLLSPTCPETGGCVISTSSTSTVTSTTGVPTTSSTSSTSSTVTTTSVTTSSGVPTTTNTTSSSVVPTTTDTTSSSLVPTTSTTSSSTAVPTTVTTSSTSTTSSTAIVSTTTIGSTTVPTTTATPSTVTTTTTMPGGCTAEPTFESLLCRLGALDDDVATATDLGALQAKLAPLVAAARERVAQAQTAPSARKRKASLKAAAKKLGAFVHRLTSRSAQKTVPADTRARLGTEQATPIRNDVLTLRQS